MYLFFWMRFVSLEHFPFPPLLYFSLGAQGVVFRPPYGCRSFLKDPVLLLDRSHLPIIGFPQSGLGTGLLTKAYMPSWIGGRQELLFFSLSDGSQESTGVCLGPPMRPWPGFGSGITPCFPSFSGSAQVKE